MLEDGVKEGGVGSLRRKWSTGRPTGSLTRKTIKIMSVYHLVQPDLEKLGKGVIKGTFDLKVTFHHTGRKKVRELFYKSPCISQHDFERLPSRCYQ